MKARNLIVWVFILTLAACASHAIPASEITRHDEWPGADHVREYKGIFFSGQPDEEALKAFKLAGVTTVVNLRPKSEMDALEFNEAAAVEELGMEYHAHPWPKKDALQREAMEAIERIVSEKHKAGERILLHCSSGNRAGGWFAIHLRKSHKMSLEQSLETGRAAGLSREGTEQQLRDYLGE